MNDQVIKRTRGKDGKFVKKAKTTVMVGVCLPPETHEKLIALIPEGGTISDVLREAIALLLQS
jgi:hypothetical protein